jgi:hypothetical protein
MYPDAQFMDGRVVEKAKIYGGELCGRVRWTPKGFQEKGVTKSETESPTAQEISNQILELLGISSAWAKITFDWSEAFFNSVPMNENEHLFVEIPWYENDPLEQCPVPGPKRYRRLLKAVPGTKRAPRAFYDTILLEFLEAGLERSILDPCLFWIRDEKGALVGGIVMHVDDGKLWVKPHLVEKLTNIINTILPVGDLQVVDKSNPTVEFKGIRETLVFNEKGGVAYTEFDQDNFLEKKLTEVNVTPTPPTRPENCLTPEEQTMFRSGVGSLLWAKRTRHDLKQCVSELAQKSSRATYKDVELLNKVVRRFKATSFPARLHACAPPRVDGELNWKCIVITDAGDTPEQYHPDGKWQGGRLIGIQDLSGQCFSAVEIASRKVRRVSHGSYDAETTWGIESLEEAVGVVELIEEGLCGRRPTLSERVWAKMEGFELGFEEMVLGLHTDCKSLCDAVANLVLAGGLTKRRKTDVADLKDEIARGRLEFLTHISGTQNPADCISKRWGAKGVFTTRARLKEILDTGSYTVL